MRRILVIGGGHAGAQFCAGMKEAEPDAELIMVSDEASLPYQRPPLSKAFLKDPAATQIDLRSVSYYSQQGINLFLSSKAVSIDPYYHRILLENGESLNYDRLVLATGTRPRRHPLFFRPYQNVFMLRTVDDARRIRLQLHQARNILVIGGGFIGLEVASTAAQLGKRVTLLEAASRLLMRSASPEISRYLLCMHRTAGVDIRLSAVVEVVDGDGAQVRGVQVGGDYIQPDMVVIGIGAVPNDELALQAGLVCDNGVIVDPFMQTSNQDILAIGDCVSFPFGSLKHRIRLESVQNAADQARCAVCTLVGRSEPYDPLPWFWSEQGTVRFQIAGLWQPEHRSVLRGDPQRNKFSILHFAGEILTSVESINSPADHIAAKKLIAEGTYITSDKAADDSVPLMSLKASAIDVGT